MMLYTKRNKPLQDNIIFLYRPSLYKKYKGAPAPISPQHICNLSTNVSVEADLTGYKFNLCCNMENKFQT